MGEQLASEQVIIEAPMSFAGSTKRIWRMRADWDDIPDWLGTTIAVFFLIVAWTVVLGWYLLFGLLLVPYRLIRRSQRKGKRDDLRHRELLQQLNRR